MSEISDEIRKITKRYRDWLIKPCKELNDLADRIDREMMERPLAADGKLLVDGETVYDSNGHEYHVNEVYPLVNVSTSTHSCSMFPDRFTHERPDSFERIADELDDFKLGRSLEDLRSIADRIRKLAKDGGHDE